jgi:hypothetical protein
VPVAHHVASAVIHRGQTAPRLAVFANRRSSVSQFGRMSSASAVRDEAVENKSRGTWS